MINKVSFMGRETLLGTVTKKTENVAKDYLCAGKVYSPEERLIAENKIKESKHPFIPQDALVPTNDNKMIKKAKDLDVDFFAETTPHRFTVIG